MPIVQVLVNQSLLNFEQSSGFVFAQASDRLFENIFKNVEQSSLKNKN
jgi:hypothetical protein